MAFSILSLALGVLYPLFSKGTQSVILNEEYARAVLIAQAKLAGLGIEEGLDVNERNGIAEDKYHWLTRVQRFPETNDADVPTGVVLREVDVTVSWDSLGKQRSIQFHSLKLAPDL